jgi:gamma-tubulin complex component 2
VGSSASIPKAKGKAKEDVLDSLPVDIQEALILEDLLYVLMVRLCCNVVLEI